MNKRGQIFIIAAIILIIALFSVVIHYNTVRTYPGLEDFDRISENYQEEYPKVYNYALYNGSDVTEAIDAFNQEFLDQTRQQDPNFGAFYIFKDESGNIHIVNLLNEKVLNIEFENDAGESISLALLSSDYEINGEICVNGVSCSEVTASISDFDQSYYYTTVEEQPQFIQVFDGDAYLGKFDLTTLTSASYLTSSDPLNLENLEPGIISNVEVSVQQY